MFERAVTALKRWFRGNGEAIQPPEAPEAPSDRRVWVRYPSNAETTCQPTRIPAGDRLPARVRDISRGGIGLLVNQPFESGSLLSVELPAESEQANSTVLAYVIHVSALGKDQWALGCTFAMELREDDLQRFGASRSHTEGDDHRAWVRFASGTEATCRVFQDTDAQPWVATVLDISASGVRLQTQKSISVGTILSLDWRLVSGESAFTILASVVRASTATGKEWMLGCNFIRELSEKEMRALR